MGYKNRNWERLQNIPLRSKPRALSIVKSQLAWQPVDTVSSHNQSSAVTSLWTKTLSLSSPSGLSRETTACRLESNSYFWKRWRAHRLADSSQFGGKTIPPSSNWGEERSYRGRSQERESVGGGGGDGVARKRTLGLIETHGRRRIT